MLESLFITVEKSVDNSQHLAVFKYTLYMVNHPYADNGTLVTVYERGDYTFAVNEFNLVILHNHVYNKHIDKVVTYDAFVNLFNLLFTYKASIVYK